MRDIYHVGFMVCGGPLNTLITFDVVGPQGQQMGQMFPPGPAAAASGFYVPTMPRPYYPNNMQQIRPQPRWPNQQQVRGPAQPGGGMQFRLFSF